MTRSSALGGSVKRWLFVLAGTVSGLIMVLSYRTPPATILASGGVASQSSGTTHSSTNTGNNHAAASTPSASKTVTGSLVNTQFGPVQVQVTAASGKITDVQAVALPNADGHSASISQYAGPQLSQQALAAQSANIDGVAGASYTSQGYRQSLQSALTQLGM